MITVVILSHFSRTLKLTLENNLKIIESKDGSSTIYNNLLDEHYHSTHGAFNEAMHVFIEAGLHQKFDQKKPIRIFEMGLGTGLNAVLTAIEALNKGLDISYQAIEAYPLESDILDDLNYAELWGDKGRSLFQMIHDIPWGQQARLYPGFLFQKEICEFEKFKPQEKFDLIYWDAFGPRVQPELWEEDIFEKLYSLSNENAILVTYSSKGTVRRAMIAAGFQVEKIPGPPGKREMLRAVKI